MAAENCAATDAADETRRQNAEPRTAERLCAQNQAQPVRAECSGVQAMRGRRAAVNQAARHVAVCFTASRTACFRHR